MVAVSCVLVSYNNGPYLLKAYESLRLQARPFDEIVIADDGSHDGSREAILAWAKADSSLTPILRDANLGVAANRDLAIRAALGPLVTTLDGDDAFLPEKNEKETASLSQAPANAVAYSDFNLIDALGNLAGEIRFDNFASLSRQAMTKRILLAPRPRDLLFSKSLYESVGGLRHHQQLYEDWDLKIRFAHGASRWVHSGVFGVLYRRHSVGLSQRDNLDHLLYELDAYLRNRSLIEPVLGADAFVTATEALMNQRIRRHRAGETR